MAIWLAAASLFLAACATGVSSQARLAAAGLDSTDAIAVILYPTPSREFSLDLERKVAKCVRNALRESHPAIRIVPGDEVRRRAFGEPAPDERLNDADVWERLALEPFFRERVSPLGIRYLISVGVTEWKHWRGWSVFPVLPYFFWGEWDWNVGSDMSARVVDLTHAATVGRAWSWAEGTSFVSVFIVIPIFKLTFPEGPACQALGRGVADLLTNPNPP